MRKAARRVRRSPRTIMRWLEEGMLSRFVDGQRVILLLDLQAAFVRRLETDVTRLRSAAALGHGTRNRSAKGCRRLPCKAVRTAYQYEPYAKRTRGPAGRRGIIQGPVVLPVWSAGPF